MTKVTYSIWTYDENISNFVSTFETKEFKTNKEFLDWIMCQDYHSISFSVYKGEVHYSIHSENLQPIGTCGSIKLNNDIAYLTIFPDPKFETVHHWDIQKIWIDGSLVLDIPYGQDHLVTDDFIQKVLKPLYDYFPVEVIDDKAEVLEK